MPYLTREESLELEVKCLKGARDILVKGNTKANEGTVKYLDILIKRKEEEIKEIADAHSFEEGQ